METTVIQTVTGSCRKAGTTIMISTILKFGGFLYSSYGCNLSVCRSDS